MASILELSELCDVVYEDNGIIPNGSDLIQKEWVKLVDSNKLTPNADGYFGVAYKNSKTGEIVISNRGTQPTNIKNLLSDLALTGHLKTSVQTDAYNFSVAVLNIISRPCKISTTRMNTGVEA